ncbi:Surface polysaccharide O-acyltransferase, integral membrane enzyme [Pilibacter termitis]|uniref:Surface polysaccharide O-acyltransferase, integral membrane enzyme n=1 Tax=Pilibacter termitis TaxID=263852 RepID=A0A1T4NG59_9ENTE|nr:acyltransferase family protein [Pilibacter termitis]SJZ78135.1 Surface polysaccharide O-acyltransferase, integral membrane enzyme [Pilibacter termitis]
MKQYNHFFEVSLMQYLSSILVILLHCDKVFSSPVWHFVFKSGFCRIAVPFFFLCSAYFFHINEQKRENYAKKWIKKQLKTYLFWSVFYLPLGLLALSEFSIDRAFYPLAVLFALGYSGTYYHLWFFPALFLAIYLAKLCSQTIGYAKSFLLALFLYTIGAIETYSSFLENTRLFEWFQSYLRIFFTSRNGLFFGFLFVLIGFYLADHWEEIHIQHLKSKLFFAISLSILEKIIIFQNQGLDKNIQFALVPLTPLLFLFLLKSSCNIRIPLRNLKAYSQYYFFLHPMVLFLLIKTSPTISGGEKFIFTLFLTHLISYICINWRIFFFSLNNFSLSKRKL